VGEARNSAVVGYETGRVESESQKTGVINGLGQVNSAGAYVPNLPFTVTLNGPAIFDATGTNTWNGNTASEPITLNWT
ncbi:cell wall protein, partial [Actinotignum timonense]|nr:cell wall protein [Actinotignum timonense]